MNKFKNIYKKTSYAIKPFVIFVATLLVTFYGNQVIFWLRGEQGALQFHHLPIDDRIPLEPWMIYFYYLTFPLGIVTFFYTAYANKKAFYNIYYTLLFSFAMSGIIYLFWQTHLTKPDFVPVNFTDKLLVSTWGATDPINNFPSQHAFMGIAVIIGCLTAGKNMKCWYKILAIILGLFVILSTFFTKQHYFIDWVMSACIMIPTYIVVALIRRKKNL